MRTDPEHFYIGVGYVDPVDRAAFELARSDHDAERADRRREAEEDAQLDRKDRP